MLRLAVMVGLAVLSGRLLASEKISGEWQTDARTFKQGKQEATALLLADKPEWDSYTASVRVRIPSGEASRCEAGLALQARDSKNYLVYSLRKKEGGVFAILRIEVDPGQKVVGDQAPVRIDTGRWHELRADVHGVDVYCYLDGKHVVDYSFAGAPPDYNQHGKTWPEDLTKGSIGLITVGTAAEFDNLRVERLTDVSHITTPQKGRRDAKGRLLARQSYTQTMRAFTEWMIGCDKVMDKARAPEAVRKLQPYLVTNFSASDDTLLNTGGEFAFNHAITITGAVQFYVFSGDKRALKVAENLADWDIANSTPSDSAMPHLPPSTVFWGADGSWKGADWGLEPDKSAYMGLAYLKLHAVTGQRKYLDAALRLSGTLLKLQQPDGSFPFRINPTTGETQTGYTCSQLWYVWFFEQLAAVIGDGAYLKARDRAFHWLLANPVRTNRWEGVYGDIAGNVESFDQWVALETAVYLIDHRSEDARYVEQARKMVEWVNKTLVVDYGLHEGVPGVLEQTCYKVVLTHHQLRLAEVYAKLWEATGDRNYKDRAVETANSVTWCLMSDGKMRQGFWYHAIGIPLVLCFNDQFCRVMAAIPETAPDGENHILQTSAMVKQVKYARGVVAYRMVGNSVDVLKVTGEPKSVTCDGRALDKLHGPLAGRAGWTYDPETQLLRIGHSGPDIEVAL